MHAEYMIVLGAILLFPLLFSIIMRLDMYAHWRSMLKTMVIVCAAYWTWDALVTARGHWSFNPAYVLGLNIAGMPLEEWLFFIVLAFVSIFTYEATRKVLSKR